MSLLPHEVYLDKVQEAIEQHPTWEMRDILEHVFLWWAGRDAISFQMEILEAMRQADEHRNDRVIR